MVRLSTLALAWLAAATASYSGFAVVHAEEAPQNVVPGSFMLECEGESLQSLIKIVQEHGGEIRREFNSKVFYGFSAQLPNATVVRDRLEHMPGVKKVWSIEIMKHQEPSPAESQATQEFAHQRRDVETPWYHMMTQIDKLHAAGFKGSGVQIAIVDTGIDYTHPDLGGCFGKGCRVALGHNFSPDGKHNDPMDCYGHGTSVADVVAGSNQYHVGVAPNATLAGYRVLDCDAQMEEDDLIAGWLKAYEDGAQIIISGVGWEGSGWPTRPAAMVVSRIVDSGIPCIAALGNRQNSGLFSTLNPSSGRGVTSVNSFARKPGAIDEEVPHAVPDFYSTFGPNWDLTIDPTIGAPGENIKGEPYNFWGTSAAAALVAGMLALIGEVRGTFDPVLLNSLLISTAMPQGDYYSVAGQGGGLARAWDAAHATTLVEPASLPFNDTQHRVQSLSLKITNTAKVSVTYHLDTLAAKTLFALSTDSSWILDFVWTKESLASVNESAHVQLSTRTLVLGPNQSASVNISAADPKNPSPDRLPVWSGWISIQSSNSGSMDSSNTSSVLTVPYLGVSGSLKEHRVLPPDGAALATPYNRNDYKIHDSGHLVAYETKSDSSISINLPVRIIPRLGTRLMRAEVMPLSPRKWLADRLADKNLRLDAFSLEAVPHSQSTRKSWSGRLESGDYIPVGEYKLAVRALRLFGDAAVKSDWDLSETKSFKITKGAGRKACEIYESGTGRLPGNALFSSLEECLQVHGDQLEDAPLVPRPQDKTLQDKCTNGEVTEEFCGTYEFCRAHDDPNALSGIKSPFDSSGACAESHKLAEFKQGNESRVQECFKEQDESVCGTERWCAVKYLSPQPTDEYGSMEECLWAHGHHWVPEASSVLPNEASDNGSCQALGTPSTSKEASKSLQAS